MRRAPAIVHAIFVALAVALDIAAPAATAQPHVPSKVDIAWNRYYEYDEIVAHMRSIAAAYPELVRLETIGKTLQGRDMVVAIVNSDKTGPDTDKPAMWIDGNVHGNEIQAAEAVLYTLWYLARSYGVNDDLTELLDQKSFYLLPSQNPDGRAYWFDAPNTPSSSRANQRPVDSDADGLFDEDPPDDLDGDGQINEDGAGGDDMNRNWPSDWQPTYIQGGAGPFPLSHPETRAIADFILAHPNIAAVQSYHNTGGMLLRGPGASYREDMYPADDRRTYDELGRVGESLLPWYRYLVLYKDLYPVHGGFVNWTAEGLGIFSFTNELWSWSKYFQREQDGDDDRDDRDRLWIFRDRLQFGDVFTDYTAFDHPTHGEILVGGTNKWSSRSTPTFMLEEECHRNFGFTAYHADQMAVLDFERIQVDRLRDGLWSLTVAIENDRLIPSRSGIARERNVGRPDILTCSGSVIAAGPLGAFDDRQFDAVRHEPGRLQVKGGIPGHGQRNFRFIVSGEAGERVTLRYESQKAKNLEASVTLE